MGCGCGGGNRKQRSSSGPRSLTRSIPSRIPSRQRQLKFLSQHNGAKNNKRSVIEKKRRDALAKRNLRKP